MRWLGRLIGPESRVRKFQAMTREHQARMSVFTLEERSTYRALSWGDGLTPTPATTAALEEMEAVAAIRLYEQARRLDSV
jgi:hypothetical protein